MYTTLSPCDMYLLAILFYGIPRVVIGRIGPSSSAEDICEAVESPWISTIPTLR
jgi:tRNA(Arg) A34 adenosine deaminase TadA